MCSSPRLIAAYHDFLRLLMPRHSPCALFSLTTSSHASRPLFNGKPLNKHAPLLVLSPQNPLALGFCEGPVWDRPSQPLLAQTIAIRKVQYRDIDSLIRIMQAFSEEVLVWLIVITLN